MVKELVHTSTHLDVNAAWQPLPLRVLALQDFAQVRKLLVFSRLPSRIERSRFLRRIAKDILRSISHNFRRESLPVRIGRRWFQFQLSIQSHTLLNRISDRQIQLRILNANRRAVLKQEIRQIVQVHRIDVHVIHLILHISTERLHHHVVRHRGSQRVADTLHIEQLLGINHLHQVVTINRELASGHTHRVEREYVVLQRRTSSLHVHSLHQKREIHGRTLVQHQLFVERHVTRLRVVFSKVELQIQSLWQMHHQFFQVV